MRPISLIALALLAGCPASNTDTWPEPDTDLGTEDPDTELDTEADTEPDTDLDTAVPETDHCGVISSDEVWLAADNPHVISCDVELEGGDLTIEAGAEVYVLNGNRLTVSADGFQSSLLVQGTETEPVYIGPASGPGPGKWGGIQIAEFAGQVSLTHTTINGAGAGLDPSASANLRATNITIHLDHVTVEDSEQTGLLLRGTAALSDSSTAVVAQNNEAYGVAVDCTRAHTLPAEDSDYSGNAIDAVLVDGGTITEAVTWKDLGVPYALDATVNLEGIVPAPAILTIEAGTKIQIVNGALRVAASGGAAGLRSEGTEDAPVVFTAYRSGVPGHYSGIEAWEATVDNQLVLRHTEIRWGGGHSINRANLLVVDTPLLADHLTSTDSEAYGIRLTGYDGYFRPGSQAVVVERSEIPLQIAASAASSIPLDADTRFVDNDIQRVELIANRLYGSTTWPVRDLPYQLNGTLHVAATAGNTATLTLPPGTHLMMDYNASIEVGRIFNEGTGAIVAVGTEADPIRIVAANSYTWGAWDAIRLGACPEGATQFAHFELAHATNGFYLAPRDALGDANCSDADIDFGWIHHMRDYAYVQVPDDFVEGTSMTYENNLLGTRP